NVGCCAANADGNVARRRSAPETARSKDARRELEDRMVHLLYYTTRWRSVASHSATLPFDIPRHARHRVHPNAAVRRRGVLAQGLERIGEHGLVLVPADFVGDQDEPVAVGQGLLQA